MLETLQVIWFILWALLWAVYFVLDGFDLGLGSLLPFIGSNEEERRIMYNAAGPFWDGNEVWLISAGGVTFAAFPKVYAVMFSALYAPLLILLFALIFRAVSFEFRGKVESGVWRGFWDLVHFLSNLVPSLLLGVTFANLFMGIPIDGEGVFHGTLMGLVNGYGIAGAIFFLVMFMLHGSLWLAIKSQGELQTRAVASATLLWPVMLILLVAFLVLTFFNTDLFSNYWSNPLLLLLPVVALAGLAGRALHAAPRPAVEGLDVQRRVHHRCDLLRRHGHVPAHAHLVHRSHRHPDGLQCLLVRADPQDHAGRGSGHGAHRAAVPVLGLPPVLPQPER